ncbi:MAG TPA: hypothetical protein PLX23_08400 [Candidatus Hydrogenedens sp.]|nr:hypothetical protein [Candidatus Hydrogenedens sp.]
MERSTIIGFVITLTIALLLSAGYIVFKASKNPTPARPSTTQTRSATTSKSPTTRPQTTSRQSAPLKVTIPEFRPALSEPEAKMRMAREVGNGGTAQPGGTADITIILEKEGSKNIRALGLQEVLPDGWAFDSVTEGAKPDLSPPKGRTPLLEFAWFNIPTFPAIFTYRVTVPKEFKEPAEIRGQTLYRADGGELRTEVVKSPVVPTTSRVTTPTSPDQSPSGKSEEMQPDGNTVPLPSQVSSPTPVKKDIPEMMTLTREVTPEKYNPNATLQVTITINHSGSSPVTALALVENLPPQFQFERIIDGPVPAIAPKKGDTSILQFVWLSIPPFPFKLIYEVSVQNNASGEKNIIGQAVYRTSGPQMQSERVITNILPQK